ncbi:type VI secretion system tip protein VgrG [candidate division KSB1 bacterium]|nr:type VI secretion system tip protein VgrG [candidate division KSB1 bacterium]
MSPLEAYKARYFFETPALSGETLQVVDFVGQDDISQVFRFDLNLVSKETDIDFAEVINKPATLTMVRGDEPTKIHGLIVDFQQGGRTADWVAYRAALVPRLWLLALNYQSRVFQNMTVEEIITQILKDAGFASDDFRFSLKASYKPREYCVQYRETDLNFISRLMEFEGMYFFFEHGDDRETMVIVDDRSENPMIDGESAISYSTGGGLVAKGEQETVSDFVCREKIVTGKVVLKDYNYRTPETALKSESQLNGDMPGMYYEYGQHFKDSSEGDRLAKVRNEEIECTRRVMTGASNCVGLRSGFKFSLKEHYRSDLDGDYLLTHVNHFGSQGAGMGMGGEATYRNDFTCIPADVQYREPRLTPEPRIPGIMTAKVETAGGDYAYIDEEGKYRVKMPFDLSDKSNGSASRAIRMAQPYSGSNYGIHFPNRANTEMVWACIDGNVDRPLGLSTVPNPSNKAPSVAGNKAQCVIRTAGQNELRFDDTIGSEDIYLHGTKDWTIDITNDKNQTIGHDETLSVGNNRSKNVGVDQSEKIGSNKTIEVGASHTETIGANKDLKVGANHNETVGANMTITIAQALTETVGINYAETVGAAMELTVGGMFIQTVGANKTTTVGVNSDENVGSNKSVGVGKNLAETVGKNQTVKIGQDLSETVSGKHTEQVTKEYALKAKKITLVADDEIEIKTGQASITLKKNGDIKINGKKIENAGMQDVKISAMNISAEAKVKNEMKGTMVTVEASGINTIKGSLVKIN